ncbi:MAG: hypothetical protein GXP03_06095 [Alphaproteobacteria bacterium]|nr:hypothetical protein [Alphaproteobacteria bacterium]
MKINRRHFVASLSMLILTGIPRMAAAASSAYNRFSKSMKREVGKIRTATNKAKSQRYKNPDQAKAARKYTTNSTRKYAVNYDRTYGQMKRFMKSDASKLNAGTRINTSKSSVKSAISRFQSRIKGFKKAQHKIARDIRRMKRDQKAFWESVSWYQFGFKLTRTEYRKVVAGVKMYGTAPGARISLDPKKKAMRSYKAAIAPEIAYIKALSASLGRVIRIYEAGLRALKAKQAKMARKSGTKTKRKPPVAVQSFDRD